MLITIGVILLSELVQHSGYLVSTVDTGTLAHYSNVIISAMASQITSVSIVCSDMDQHQSSASLVFVRGIHWWLMNSPHKGPVTQKMFPFDDVIMTRVSVATVLSTHPSIFIYLMVISMLLLVHFLSIFLCYLYDRYTCIYHIFIWNIWFAYVIKLFLIACEWLNVIITMTS